MAFHPERLLNVWHYRMICVRIIRWISGKCREMPFMQNDARFVTGGENYYLLMATRAAIVSHIGPHY